MSFLEITKPKGTAAAVYRDLGSNRAAPSHSAGESALPDTNKMVIPARRKHIFSRPVLDDTSLPEKVFNSLVALKTSVSQYAMHLTTEERHRIFDELDNIINVDDWHEGDTLPSIAAFRDFLKWMIYSKYFKWMSLGVSDEGGFLVAWRTKYVLLTAKFSGLAGQDGVKWTAEITSKNGEVGYAVGKSPLRLFTEQAMFYLQRSDADESGQH